MFSTTVAILLSYSILIYIIKQKGVITLKILYLIFRSFLILNGFSENIFNLFAQKF